MRKRMSAAALGLRMTWPGVVVCILAAAALQLAEFSKLPITEDSMVELLLDSVATPAWWCKYAMMLTMVLPLARAKSRYDYTLNRLRISEGECLAIWSLVFGGYFLLSWGVLLVTALGMLKLFAGHRPMDSMDFFLAAYRSRYFHTLLPHGEPWAFARNASVCLSYGILSAWFPWMLRNKKVWIGVVALLALSPLQPWSMGSQGMDVVWCMSVPALTVALFLAGKWVRSEED